MERRFKCSYSDCKFSASRKDLLKTHVDEFHKKILKACLCGKTMTTASLSRHKRACVVWNRAKTTKRPSDCVEAKEISMNADAANSIIDGIPNGIAANNQNIAHPPDMANLLRELQHMNISPNEVVSIRECTVKIVELTGGRVCCLHEDIRVNNIPMSIVPSQTFPEFNA